MRKNAVITGDIVDSTKIDISTREILLMSLQNFAIKMEKEFNVRVELFRGDSFQCLVNRIDDALIIALLFKTHISSLNSRISKTDEGDNKIKPEWSYPFNARISVGIGESANVNENSLAISDGIAFRISGRMLDEIKGKKQYFIISSDDEHNDELRMESLLLDTLLRKNTILQNEVINKKLQNQTESQIANELGIKQPAVNQRLDTGNWHAINAMVRRFKQIYTNG